MAGADDEGDDLRGRVEEAVEARPAMQPPTEATVKLVDEVQHNVQHIIIPKVNLDSRDPICRCIVDLQRNAIYSESNALD